MKKITREEALERWPFEGSAEWHDIQIKKFRALLVEVYNHGENSDLHRRIGEALGAAPGEDAKPDQP